MCDGVLETLMALNNQAEGKDRIFRLFQYGSRLCWWLIEKCRRDKDTIDKLKKLENTLSTGRKLIRLGRSLDAFYGSLKSVHLPDLILRITLTMAKINNALYLIVDHLIWLNRVGLVQVDNVKWSKMSNKFWLYSVVMLLGRDVYEIFRLIRENREKSFRMSQRRTGMGTEIARGRVPSNSSSGGGQNGKLAYCLHRQTKLSIEQKCVALDTIKNACDLFIPMSALNLPNISPGFIGLFGVVSSAISVFVLLNPSYSMKPR